MVMMVPVVMDRQLHAVVAYFSLDEAVKQGG
jgi:hypothetical protein